MPYEDQDKELDPKRLKFGMSQAEVKEAEQKEKARRKKMTKGWRPEGH